MKSTPSQLWLRDGNAYGPCNVSGDSLPQALPNYVFRLQHNPRSGFYLEKLHERFPMPAKIYALNQPFIDRVSRTAAEMPKTLGILLNGLRGTGKTLTCMAMCNALALPVVLIDQAHENVGQFISDFEQDAVFFIDEFEKIFGGNGGDSNGLLPVMDGAMAGAGRKIFMLTTNSLSINENLIQRPGRIRYLKTFDNLSVPHIQEIVEDRLIDKNRVASVVDFVSQLELITIDIVMAVVDETNIHGQDPELFADCFNVRKIIATWDIYQTDEEAQTEKLLKTNVRVHPSEFQMGSYHVGDSLYFNGNRVGRIHEVLDFDTVTILAADEDEELTEAQEKTKKKMTVRIARRRSKNAVFRRNDFGYSHQPVGTTEL